jgi:hypothetical protein
LVAGRGQRQKFSALTNGWRYKKPKITLTKQEYWLIMPDYHNPRRPSTPAARGEDCGCLNTPIHNLLCELPLRRIFLFESAVTL